MKKVFLTLVTLLNLASCTNIYREETMLTHAALPELRAYCQKFNPRGEWSQSICHYVFVESHGPSPWWYLEQVIGALLQEFGDDEDLTDAQKNERAQALAAIAKRLPTVYYPPRSELVSFLETHFKER